MALKGKPPASLLLEDAVDWSGAECNKPITFIGLLSAGLICEAKGNKSFDMTTQVDEIRPLEEHYGCCNKWSICSVGQGRAIQRWRLCLWNLIQDCGELLLVHGGFMEMWNCIMVGDISSWQTYMVLRARRWGGIGGDSNINMNPKINSNKPYEFKL